MRILTVCTANRCRSPMAEALLRRHLISLGVAAEVKSCGLLGPGSPAVEEVVEVMATKGLDVSAHSSRRLSDYLIAESNLVLPMTRQHLREVVMQEPAAFRRTFTLKELVRRGEKAGGRRGVEVEEWLELLSEDRRPADLLGDAEEDDVADPTGGPYRAYRSIADELDDLCRRVAALLAGGAGDPARS